MQGLRPTTPPLLVHSLGCSSRDRFCPSHFAPSAARAIHRRRGGLQRMQGCGGGIATRLTVGSVILSGLGLALDLVGDRLARVRLQIGGRVHGVLTDETTLDLVRWRLALVCFGGLGGLVRGIVELLRLLVGRRRTGRLGGDGAHGVDAVGWVGAQRTDGLVLLGSLDGDETWRCERRAQPRLTLSWTDLRFLWWPW